MSISCLVTSRQCLLSAHRVISQSALTGALVAPCSSVLVSQVRWAGHNKWSNIRHIKAERDGLLAKKFKLYHNKISLVLKQTNNNLNLETNSTLKKIVDEALAQNVPKATIDRILKRGSNNEELCTEYITEIRGPGRAAIIVESLVKNRGLIPVKLNPIMRKFAALEEKGIINMFDKKGIIIAPLKKGSTIDDAETDAIEAGAEEVSLIDEDLQTLEFITPDSDLVKVKGSLIKAGYDCKEASISYIPNVEVSLNVIERKALEKLLELLMNEDIVTNVHCNAS